MKKLSLLHSGAILQSFKLLLKFWDSSILKLSSLSIVAPSLSYLQIILSTLYLLTNLLNTFNFSFFIFPGCLHGASLIFKFSKLAFNTGKTFLRQMIILIFKSRNFYLELHDLTIYLIHLSWHRVKLCLDHRTCFVHKVDGLIRKESICNISVRKCSRRN